MKPTLPPSRLLCACLIGIGAQYAHAQGLFSESFNYTPGQGLAGQVNPGNNTPWTGGNTSELQIGSAELTYPGLQEPSGNDLVYTSSGSSSTSYNTFTAVSSGSIYYSFVIDCTTLPTANEYVSALNPGTTTPGGSTDALSLYVGSSGSGWKIGVRTTGGGTGAAYSGTLSANTSYLVVGELTLGSSPVANLYVDPTPGAAQPGTPTATQSTSTAIASIDDVGFKVQSATTTGDFEISDLQIGQSWASVTPAAVPEPNTLTLLGGGFVLWAWRRFQSRA